DSFLGSGEYQGKAYTYKAALEASGGSAPSPFSTKFLRLHIPRIEVEGNTLKDDIAYFQAHPDERFISDGDISVVSAPKDLAPRLGDLLPDPGRPVVRY
ncbi:MAG: hypothetical protein M1337_05095, partial [Actinobacteria bacterium]|nr:hypothetical protein [Actinomycetota bacterium]